MNLDFLGVTKDSRNRRQSCNKSVVMLGVSWTSPSDSRGQMRQSGMLPGVSWTSPCVIVGSDETVRYPTRSQLDRPRAEWCLSSGAGRSGRPQQYFGRVCPRAPAPAPARRVGDCDGGWRAQERSTGDCGRTWEGSTAGPEGTRGDPTGSEGSRGLQSAPA